MNFLYKLNIPNLKCLRPEKSILEVFQIFAYLHGTYQLGTTDLKCIYFGSWMFNCKLQILAKA